jgi:hypothetical protein
MQLKDIQPVQGGEVDHLQDEVLGHEVPGHVQHDPAPREPRRILDAQARHGGALARQRRGSQRVCGQELS